MRNAVLDENGIVINLIEGALPDLRLMPDDGTARIGDTWDGAHFVPTPAPAPSREQLKAQRQSAVDAITVTVGGKVFDGDEISQGRMVRALKAADIIGQDSCTWVLRDNTPTTVTRADLAQALALSIQAQAAIWVIQP